MSLTTDKNVLNGYGVTECFCCHETLHGPAIIWSGATFIAFHPSCLEEWLIMIERDLIEWQKGRDFAQGWIAGMRFAKARAKTAAIRTVKEQAKFK